MGLFRKKSKVETRVGTGLELPRWREAPPRRTTHQLLRAYAELPRLGTVVDVVGDAVAQVEWCVAARTDRPGKSLAVPRARWAPPDSRHLQIRRLIDAGEAVEVPDHPLLRLLEDPNDYMTGRELIKLVTLHWDLVGEAFLAVEEVAGFPVGLWPLPPDLVLRLPDLAQPKGDRTYWVMAGGKTFSLPMDSIIAIKRLNPADPLGRGVGIASALGDELDTDEYTARFVKNSFYNNALPGAVIAIEGFSQSGGPAAIAFKESLVQEYGGSDRAGRVMITNGKTTMSRLDTPFKDMQLVELRKFLNDFIRMTYRVPPEIIGDIQSSNKATSYAAREHLAEQATKPRLELLRSAFQKHLLPRFGGEAVLDYASPVPADREYQLRVMGTLPEAFSYDEWRAAAGLKPDPNRQGYPLPLPGQKPGGQQTPAPAPGGAAEANQEAVAESG